MAKTSYTVMVINDPDVGYEHEYDVIVKETDLGTKLTLKHANNDSWAKSIRGTKAMSILNTGNGVIIKGCGKELDYSELFCLRLLLNFDNHLSENELEKTPAKIVKKGKKTIKL